MFFFSNVVLSSPEKRTIYDVYGQKGLDAGWEVSIICSTVGNKGAVLCMCYVGIYASTGKL